MAKLTDKQTLFVEAYLECWNATEAARRAQYKHPRQMGSENLAKPAIRTYIDKRLKELNVRPDKIPDGRINCRARKASFVYLIRATNGLVKIGKTVDVESRLKQLGWASPVALELRGSIETPFADELEDELHARFEDKRVHGEWFALEEGDIQDILECYG